MLPKLTHLAQDDTHRLIPSRYLDDGESVLSRLGLPPAQMKDLFQLDDATNDRLLGESNQLHEITVHELVFGVPHYHIVNAAFAHSRPKGTRFMGPGRGVWYAGFVLKTAQEEVAFHYAQWLKEVNWREEEIVTYRDYVADFEGEFHDLRNDPRFKKCLDPDDYRASQHLGRRLLDAGSVGIVYPSVRHHGGTCVGCFRPAMVTNVRQGTLVTFTFADPNRAPKIRVSK